jgi:poly(3-hydroxybutyrate) depolymerase
VRALVLALISCGLWGRASAEETSAAFALRSFDRPPLLAVTVWAPPPGTPGRFETLVLLHGRQGDAPDPTWMVGLRHQPAFQRRILIVPSLPSLDSDWADAANTRAIGALVKAVAETYPVDRDALYVVGYSAGASRVLNVAWRIPLPLAGIAALAGDVTRPWRGPGAKRSVPAPKLLLVCMTGDPGPHTSCAINEANRSLLEARGVKGISFQKLPGDHRLDLGRAAAILESWIASKPR